MLRSIALAALACVLAQPAAALVGGAPAAEQKVARHVVLLVGSRGTSCSGVALAQNLVLTAAHCVLQGADYRLVEFDAQRRPLLRDVSEIARHPLFNLEALLGHRATADVALVKLAAPLPASFAPAPLAETKPVKVGDRILVAGTGVAIRGDGRTGGTVRAASLAATGRPGTLQLRLYDPATKGARAGLGACTGDSGAPAFVPAGDGVAVIGVVSWSTGPKLSAGCGGLTGVTPLARYREWVVETARKMGAGL